MPGIFLNPSGCCCGGCTGGGTLCVALTSWCPADKQGVTVTVSGPSSTSGSTDDDGEVCFTGLTPGEYSVSTSKEECHGPSTSATVTCGNTTTVGGVEYCDGTSILIFTVTGCGNLPLPDAVVTISGPSSGSGITGSDGKASIPLSATGLYSYTVTHPSGRFEDVSGTFRRFDTCDIIEFGDKLDPADGYVCCDFSSSEPFYSPYPLPTTMYITDDYGTMTMNVNPLTCIAETCVTRPLDECSADTGLLPTCFCTPTGSVISPPTDIGTHDGSVLWTLRLNNVSFAGGAYYKFARDSSVGGALIYKSDLCAGNVCSPSDVKRIWRRSSDCDTIKVTLFVETHGPASMTVNSILPFNVTFGYANGTGYGPVPVASPIPTGDTYTSQAILSETP